MSAKPLALDEPILNLPDMSSFKASSAESTSATASTSSKSLPTFDPIKSKRSASTFMPFDAERKRGASLVSGADNDAEDHTKQPQAKRPKLSKKGAGSYAKDKGKEKMKSKGKNQVQSANDVTMDDAQQDDEADEALPASRLLEDGTLIMSYKDPDGKVHEMRVKDYKPYNHRIRNTTVDPDDLEEDVDLWQRHIAQQPSLDPGSSATSSMDVDASDIPAHLVSLLSLQTSPNKKHRREIARTKYKLYKQVLQEPSCRAAPAAGLLELAQENEDKAASTGWSTAAEGGNLGDDEGQLSGADDDWESEPEGWKELGGMDLAGFENDLDPW